MEWLARCLLRAIEAYESEHAAGPTAAELAGEIGVSPHFGHDYLAERLRRQVTLGRISRSGGRFRLTEAGREELVLDEWGWAPRSGRISKPTCVTP